MKKLNVMLVMAMVGIFIFTQLVNGSPVPTTIDFESSEGYSTGGLNGQVGWVTGGGSSGAITDTTAYSGSQSVYLGGTEEWAYLNGLYSYNNWYWAVGGAFSSQPPKYIHFMYKPTDTWSENNYQGMWLTKNKYFGGVLFQQKNGEIGVYGSPVWFPFGTSGHSMERLGTGSLAMDNWHQVIVHPFLGADSDDPGTNPDVLLQVWVANVETGQWVVNGAIANLDSGSSNAAYDAYSVFDGATECEDIAIGNYTQNAYVSGTDTSYDNGYGYFDHFYFQQDEPSFIVPEVSTFAYLLPGLSCLSVYIKRWRRI